MRGLIWLSICLISSQLGAQQKVTFYADDSLKITADLYLIGFEKPFVLMFHQAGSSRGEFSEIAPKLMKLGYNCLAVDLRSGEKSNFIKNETALAARAQKIPNRFIDASKDIDAAVNYVLRYNHQPVILFGSSYSASLALMKAKHSNRVRSVIAFSPGEYFRPELVVREEIAGLDVPVFIAVSEIEYSYVNELSSQVATGKRVIFKPSLTRGVHGAKALWESNEGSSEYWLNLTHFFRKLQEV
ncbi:MAG: dienelactone hydrolase family protein [Bacteroidota bacterium]|nr:MAG: dienelactone hydrolase family protein [Bacteroidota bacterium]